MNPNDGKLNAETLRSWLHYSPDTGLFVWLKRPARCVLIGDAAGSLHPSGKVFIRIQGFTFAAHRLAWLYVYGKWPKDEIDHINGVGNDNRIANLRECAGGQNNQNISIYSTNSSGFIGVGWHKATQMWRARIDVDGEQKHLGLFDTREDAYAAYCDAKRKLHSFQPEVRT